MQLQLDVGNQLVGVIPELSISALTEVGGRKFVQHRQKALAGLILTAYQLSKTHRWDSASTYFTQAALEKRLKARNAYGPLLRPFFSFQVGKEKGASGWSMKGGITKLYRLHPHIEAAVSEVFRSPEPVPVIDQESGAVVTAGDLPSGPLGLPSFIPLDPQRIDRRLAEAEGWQKVDAKAVRQLEVFRKWAQCFGGVPCLYGEQSTGRLGPTDQGPLHLVLTPQFVRAALFAETDYHDLDLISCHWSIFVSYAKALGFECPYAEAYLTEKDLHHARLSQLIGDGTPDLLKAVFISFMPGSVNTGRTISQESESLASFKDRVGVARVLAADPFVILLREELRSIGLAIIAGFAAERRFRNALGVPFDEARKKPSQRLTHLLVGAEQLLMKLLIERLQRAGQGVIGLIYDGLILDDMPKVSPWALEGYLRRETQAVLTFPLDVRLKVRSFRSMWQAFAASNGCETAGTRADHSSITPPTKENHRAPDQHFPNATHDRSWHAVHDGHGQLVHPSITHTQTQERTAVARELKAFP